MFKTNVNFTLKILENYLLSMLIANIYQVKYN